MSRLRSHLRRRRGWYVAGSAVLVALVVFVLVWFQPQKLFIDDTVEEPVPVSLVDAQPDATQSQQQQPGTKTARPAQPEILARGDFRSGEHTTTGEAQVLRLTDGRLFLRLEDLNTSNGPALHVWLTTADIGADDGTINDAPHLELGGLKGNIGDQNYALPRQLDPDFRTAVIWCARFHVSFGAAPLTPSG